MIFPTESALDSCIDRTGTSYPSPTIRRARVTRPTKVSGVCFQLTIRCFLGKLKLSYSESFDSRFFKLNSRGAQRRERFLCSLNTMPFKYSQVLWPKAINTVAWGTAPGRRRTSRCFGRRPYSRLSCDNYGLRPNARTDSNSWGVAPGYDGKGLRPKDLRIIERYRR